MRLLWAKALDEHRTAIVIESGTKLMGGVALMTDHTLNVTWSPIFDMRTDMRFRWEWSRTVDSADVFERQREWEKPPEQLPATKMLEHRS